MMSVFSVIQKKRKPENRAMNVQLPAKSARPIRDSVPKTQLPVKFDVNIFCGKFMVFHALRDILFKPGELISLFFQKVPDILSPEWFRSPVQTYP